MLGLKKVTQAVESTSFRCGNEGIERQISDSYYATLLREGYGYEIVVQAETEFPVSVGYCMIKLVTLNKKHNCKVWVDDGYNKRDSLPWNNDCKSTINFSRRLYT